jgi:hypothetical protein
MAIRTLIAFCLISAAVMAADASVNLKVSVAHAEWATCTKKIRGVKLSLQLQVENDSQLPLVLGSVNVLQERLYREGQKGKLELIGTTATPDEFPSDLADPFAGIEEKNLPGHTSETFTIVHCAYISSSAFQSDGHAARITASFHITNVRRDGSVSDYWSRPITITLPQNCEL